MKLYLLIFLLIIILVLVFIQDFRKRTIHVSLPILIFSLAIYINYILPVLTFNFILINIAFVSVNMIGLTLFLSIKNKKLFNPVDKSIGLGDIVFLLAITPLFDLKSFILFFILGLMFSLIMHSVFLFFNRTQTIPLAGYLSVFLVVNILSKTLLKINMLF